MTNELENEPKLRFPEFNEEWEEKILDEVSTFSKGKGISKNDLSKDGTPCILYGELYTTYDFIINKIKSKTLLDTKNLVKGKKNQVLIPSSGETPLDIATAAVINTTEDMLLGGDINVLTPVQKYDGKFISLSINGKNKSNLSKYAQGKSVVHLYNNDIKKLKIKFPVKNSEQRKIGDFFSKLDRQIELEEQKLEKLEEQKKGYMQKIFSQELRFKDGNGNNYSEWIKTNLKFLVSYKNGKGYEKEVVQNGKYNIINLNSISTKGMLKDSGKYTDFEDITLKKNDLIMILSDVAKGNLIGKTAIIDQDDKYLLNQRVASLRIKDESTSNVLFIYYFINYFRQYFINMSTGMSQLNINKSTVEDFLIYLPYIEEQDKIGNFFSNLDKSIIKQLDKIELLKERKKGFLQKMFV
ncbi:restriction endonuclease subunit S [Staphylococcus cohnii]|uniref:restriction endonuclease subunit S n=1 Tax=Staphylococcus cohnii TaxID=29382 RepID=UPI001865CFC8|nr:restriction endonuclease subunit S [Staphylococcus cohnii]